MIVKRVSAKSARKRGFAALAAYIVDAQDKQERVGAVFITNCRCDQPNAALTEILNTQLQNVRATSDKTYHMIVSFRQGEKVDDATLRQIEARLCDALGYGEHQRISAVHRDTDNLHMHVAINKIHPTRYTMREPFNDFWILAQASERLEREFGLDPDNHQARKSASENRADDMEKHAGIESLIGWIQRGCAVEMRQASTWDALHAVMGANGLRLHERGNGLVVSADDGTTVKASSIGREFSKARLETRMGSFVQAPESDVGERSVRTYEARPLKSRVDTTGLYAAYQEERQLTQDARLRESAQATARKKGQVESAKRGARLKRAVIKMSGMSRPAKKLMYAAISSALLRELDAIVAESRQNRRQIGERHRRQTWADWLQTKARDGNPEALKALRARSGSLATRRDSLAGSEHHMPNRVFAGQDGVTKQGTVIYRLGGTTVRDDGKALHVAGHSDTVGLQAAIRMAQTLYGNRIHVNGSAAFKEAVVQAAVAGAMALVFDDATLEQHRQQLTLTGSAKENRHERSAIELGRPATARVVRDGAGAAPAGENGRQTATHVGHRSGGAHQSNTGAIGRRPPPERQHCLRTLSELGMVRIGDGSQVLLPGHVPAHLEQPRTAAADHLRRHVPRPERMKGKGAAQYVQEQEQRRQAGLPVPRHIAFDGAARMLPLAGTQTCGGQGLALLRDGDDILVLPVDTATLRRLQLKPVGTRVGVSTKGIVKSRVLGR